MNVIVVFPLLTALFHSNLPGCPTAGLSMSPLQPNLTLFITVQLSTESVTIRTISISYQSFQEWSQNFEPQGLLSGYSSLEQSGLSKAY